MADAAQWALSSDPKPDSFFGQPQERLKGDRKTLDYEMNQTAADTTYDWIQKGKTNLKTLKPTWNVDS